ncbi:unnamed protein product [Callosobruchus maculatus]|uniref:Uncharacterized protein n=1 Tax=Callosobruchus maculatus TaxID=64391 RepID=A0A653D5Q4_CALMS|nr:unnamed protein product [Callosobruchus maculatus]
MQVLSLKSEATSGCSNKCLSKTFFLTVLKVHFVHSCSLLVTDVAKSGCFLSMWSSSACFSLNVASQWMQIRSLKSEVTSGCFNKCLSKILL